MKHSLFTTAFAVWFCSVCAFAQKSSPAEPAIPMPADRADDSYRIYSSLLPLGETAGNNWPHELWLVQDATISAVPADEPCSPPPNTDHSAPGMNPHLDVHPPQDQLQDYLEILRDFDLHCHDRIKLDPDKWNVKAPLRLLSPEEQKEFESTRFGGAKDTPAVAKFKGAAALYAFSEVYFNVPHTVALVYATHWCGGLCGEGFWLAFSLKDGEWKMIHWPATRWIS
jgi:hypothetical protein